jgi:hypothetical protein
MEPMNIWQLQEYAKQNGFNRAEFMGIGTGGGIFQGKFLDAYSGIIAPRGKDGFIMISTLRAALGDDAQYIVTGGVPIDDDGLAGHMATEFPNKIPD